MKKRTIYVAYGSNLHLRQMAFRCPTAEPVGITVLKNWRLLFRGHHESAVATIERCAGYEVPVLLWDIKPEDEANLDVYEGYPHLYHKEYIPMKINGEIVDAMVYIMNEGRPISTPSSYYYTTIRQGYLDCGFDLDVLKKASLESARDERI